MFILLILTKRMGKMDKNNFISSVMKKYNLNMITLPSRIAFQKTFYLLKELGESMEFNFIWHTFGPYCQELASLGFSITEEQKITSPEFKTEFSDKFENIIGGKIGDSRFLELLADIVFIKKQTSNISDLELFSRIISHRSYLNNEKEFYLALTKLKDVKLL